MKNGPPTKVVKTPTGISWVKTVRVKVSAINRNVPPKIVAKGIIFLLSAPTIILAIWGTLCVRMIVVTGILC